jgi:hypothetical protein
MLAHEAVRAGYDGIEHINMLFLNFGDQPRAQQFLDQRLAVAAG